MNKGLFSRLGRGGVHFSVAAEILLIFIVGFALIQSPLLEITAQPTQGSAGQAEVVSSSYPGNGSLRATRPADAYSAQLAQLAQRARERANYSQANTYAMQLERLAQQGRAAAVDNRAPASANEYINYLEHLRRLGQAAYIKQAFLSAGANEYVLRLDELRRMGVEAYLHSNAEQVNANK